MPAALALEGNQPLDRRTRDHRQRDSLGNVRYFAVPSAEQRGAHRTRLFALWTEHIIVDDQGILAAKQTGEINRTVLANERVGLFDLAARRQRAAQLGHPFDMAAKFDLLG